MKREIPLQIFKHHPFANLVGRVSILDSIHLKMWISTYKIAPCNPLFSFKFAPLHTLPLPDVSFTSSLREYFTCRKSSRLLGRVDIYVKRVHNSLIGLYRRGEVASPDGLGNPTPTGIDPM
ncbi:hypothetical protein F4X33_19895 [Candidatus Poribacteria bacterium]|nr:hypothetical protein [Candidatus Poribacteria bacterium]